MYYDEAQEFIRKCTLQQQKEVDKKISKWIDGISSDLKLNQAQSRRLKIHIKDMISYSRRCNSCLNFVTQGKPKIFIRTLLGY